MCPIPLSLHPRPIIPEGLIGLGRRDRAMGPEGGTVAKEAPEGVTMDTGGRP